MVYSEVIIWLVNGGLTISKITNIWKNGSEHLSFSSLITFFTESSINVVKYINILINKQYKNTIQAFFKCYQKLSNQAISVEQSLEQYDSIQNAMSRTVIIYWLVLLYLLGYILRKIS